jgi:hypothetical protein
MTIAYEGQEWNDRTPQKPAAREHHDWYNELPLTIKPENIWVGVNVDARFSRGQLSYFECPYCSALVREPRLHLEHSPRCLQDITSLGDLFEEVTGG